MSCLTVLFMRFRAVCSSFKVSVPGCPSSNVSLSIVGRSTMVGIAPPHGSRRRCTAGDGTSAWQQATVLDGRRHQCVATQYMISISQPAKGNPHQHFTARCAKPNPAAQKPDPAHGFDARVAVVARSNRPARVQNTRSAPRCTAHTPRVECASPRIAHAHRPRSPRHSHHRRRAHAPPAWQKS